MYDMCMYHMCLSCDMQWLVRRSKPIRLSMFALEITRCMVSISWRTLSHDSAGSGSHVLVMMLKNFLNNTVLCSH